MDLSHIELGTIATTNQLLTDLYIELRQKVNAWAAVTHQTAQARMGYIGQHLVSTVTGFKGGKSGARGKDLILPSGGAGEIKTCYRVDQLGQCQNCKSRIAAIEEKCPDCKSTNIDRKDDSKWLIGIRHEEEYAHILDPIYYYLVLFDFVDLNDPTEIRASIWRVDSQSLGLALCLVDYRENIRAKSKSKAPFNLWPYSLKFAAMRPILIYQSVIDIDGEIETKVFPGKADEAVWEFDDFKTYSQSRNLSIEKIRDIAETLQITLPDSARTKRDLLGALQSRRHDSHFTPELLADVVAHALYYPEIQDNISGLPQPLRDKIEAALANYHSLLDSA